jgi:hypothetical protein
LHRAPSCLLDKWIIGYALVTGGERVFFDCVSRVMATVVLQRGPGERASAGPSPSSCGTRIALRFHMGSGFSVVGGEFISLADLAIRSGACR